MYHHSDAAFTLQALMLKFLLFFCLYQILAYSLHLPFQVVHVQCLFTQFRPKITHMHKHGFDFCNIGKQITAMETDETYIITNCCFLSIYLQYITSLYFMVEKKNLRTCCIFVVCSNIHCNVIYVRAK